MHSKNSCPFQNFNKMKANTVMIPKLFLVETQQISIFDAKERQVFPLLHGDSFLSASCSTRSGLRFKIEFLSRLIVGIRIYNITEK